MKPICKIRRWVEKIPVERKDGPTFYRQENASMCETHGWRFNNVAGFGHVEENLCPLGRIEQATEQGLEQIKAARDAA